VEAAAGCDLSQWSRVWLEEAGVTLLRPVTVEREEGVYERVAIVQEVPAVYERFATIPHRGLPPIEVQPSLRPHRIGVAGYSMTQDGVAPVWALEADVAGAWTELPELAGVVIPDLLVVNDRDLTFAKTRLDAGGLALLPRGLGQIADSLTRALIWGSLWDGVRDAEIPARSYVDIVLDTVDTETSSMTIQSLLARLRQTLQLYVAPALRTDAIDDAATRLVHLTMAADPGSDQQLQFFKSFAGLAGNPTQLGFVASVLDGSGEVPGLVVDTDLRWELLTDLVAAGVRGEPAIAAELARDHTLPGREWAAGARAALPGLDDKRRAWHLGVVDQTISNGVQRSILANFAKVTDPAVLRQFAIEYFAQIESVWSHRSREMAHNIVELLFPLRSVNDRGIDVLEMTDHWLDRLEGRLPALRRLVVASREEVVCARAAQRLDAAL
jgi:aminopeptidase N